MMDKENTIELNEICEKKKRRVVVMNAEHVKSVDDEIDAMFSFQNDAFVGENADMDDRRVDETRLSPPVTPTRRSPTEARCYKKQDSRISQSRNRRRFSTISNVVSNASTDAVSAQQNQEAAREHFRKIRVRLLSCMYTAFVVTFGCVCYLIHQLNLNQIFVQAFACIIILLAEAWLIFLHIDFAVNKKKINQLVGDALPFRLLPESRNRSFYTKVASVVLFLGHLCHEGLRLCQHIDSYVEEARVDSTSSLSMYSLVLHALRPIYSLLQLFMIFKYADVVIDRYQILANFAFMHCIGTNICIWIASTLGSAMDSGESIDQLLLENGIHHNANTTGYSKSVCQKAAPYVSNFTVEYNLLVIRVWFVIWQHIGLKCPAEYCTTAASVAGTTKPGSSRRKISWSDKKGALVAGVLLIISMILCIIFFFVYVNQDDQIKRYTAMNAYHAYQAFLSCVAIVSTIRSFLCTAKLDYRPNCAVFVDDVFLAIPLPFFFVYTILPFVSNKFHGNYLRSVSVIFMTMHVILQTVFIIDGLRRYMPDKDRVPNSALRKSIESTILFSIIVNLTLWIFNSATRDTAEFFHSKNSSVDASVWLTVAHVTLPQMLFYWFHSSVCLVDIWLTQQSQPSN